MNVLNGLKEAFRDEARDKVCEVLQNIGINAQMSERGRPEENLELRPYCESLGIIDIAESPIRWINVVRKRVGHVTEYFLKYGVPDSRLSPSSPKVRIEAVPKYQFRLFGKITDLKWEREDSDLQIIGRMNSDGELKQMIIESRVNFTIHVHIDRGIWIISNDYSNFLTSPLYPPAKYSEEEWRICQAIAHHLVADLSQDSSRISGSE